VHKGVWLVNLRERGHLEVLDVDGWVISKWIIKRWGTGYGRD
jgi:hypothetical protein